MDEKPDAMRKLVRDYANRDVVRFRPEMTVKEALELIRERSSGGQTLVYFYVTDAGGKLAGVLPARALLGAQPDEKVRDMMVSRVIAIPETATLLDACEFFVLHKFLAFPVVDSQRRIIGTVDINLFNEEVFGIPKTERPFDMFQAIGFHISQVQMASPLRVFRVRFPWLLVTIAAGTVCAFLAHAHEATLKNTLAVALFLALVLALGESVAVQSMAFVLETLQMKTKTPRWFLGACKREALTALPLAAGCGAVVFAIVWAMGREVWPAAVISGSLALSVCSSCLLGVTVPTLLHAAKLDLTIAAGPITLAVADVVTLLVYLGLTSALM